MSKIHYQKMHICLIQSVCLFVCLYFSYSKNYLKSCHINRYYHDHFRDQFTVMLENYFIPLKMIVK